MAELWCWLTVLSAVELENYGRVIWLTSTSSWHLDNDGNVLECQSEFFNMVRFQSPRMCNRPTTVFACRPACCFMRVLQASWNFGFAPETQRRALQSEILRIAEFLSDATSLRGVHEVLCKCRGVPMWYLPVLC